MRERQNWGGWRHVGGTKTVLEQGQRGSCEALNAKHNGWRRSKWLYEFAAGIEEISIGMYES
jgi:hypothetical protein